MRQKARVLVTPVSEEENLFLQNVEIRLAGYFCHAQGHLVEQASGEDTLLLYCMEGRGFVELDGRSMMVSQGEAVVLLPGSSRVYGSDAEAPWSIIWVAFSGRMVDFLRERLDVQGEGVVLRQNLRETSPLLEQMMETLEEGQDRMRLMEASAALQLALCRMIAANLRGGVQRQYVERAKEYLLTHIEKGTSLQELARAAGISKFYLIRIFKAHFGASPMEYLRGIRMQRACDLLLETDLPIKEIGRQLSYGSAYRFAQCFRQYAGCTPSEFRRSVRQNPGDELL